jgi:ribosomal protein L12E/L44/L45/RPP1/RPP2
MVNGVPHIEKSRPNIPLLALAYAHEGCKPPKVPEEDFSDAKDAAEAENPSDEDVAKWTTLSVDQAVYENFATYVNWYLLLVACQQVRALDDSNLTQFCKMTGAPPLPSRVQLYLRYFAATQLELSDVTDIIEKFSDNKFFEYHTTASSTPNLCLEALAEAPNMSLFTFTEEVAIKEASIAENDLEAARRIHPVTLVKVHAIHEAAGTLPPKWYMGEKAVARFSGKKYSAMVKFLKAIFTKQSNTEELGDRDMDTLVSDLALLVDTFAASEVTDLADRRTGVTAKERDAGEDSEEDDSSDDDDGDGSDKGEDKEDEPPVGKGEKGEPPVVDSTPDVTTADV